jgi:hypothetical protein
VTGTYEGRWHAERQTVYSKRLKFTGSRRHVTLNAQNRPKLGRRRPWRSLVSAGGAQRETERRKMTESLGNVTVREEERWKEQEGSSTV